MPRNIYKIFIIFLNVFDGYINSQSLCILESEKMKKGLWRKGMGIGIIALFFGIAIVPSIGVTSLSSFQGENVDVAKNLETSIVENAVYADETEYWAVVVSTFENCTFVYDTLIDEQSWDESHIKLLYLDEATKDNILDALDWLAQNSDSNDIVLFSDNSHGCYKRGVCGIAPWDYDEIGMITIDELDEKFDNMEAYGMCLVFDCCFSGNFVDRTFPLGKNNVVMFKEVFQAGIEGNGRVVLMETMKFGTGFKMSFTRSDTNESETITFSRFIAQAFREKIDYNGDGLCSAEEAFRYARKEFLPYAIFAFLMIKVQILSFIASGGFFMIPFPTIYDGFEGELPIVFR
jgi:hypothetical protein